MSASPDNLPHDETLRRIRDARFLVAPSRCYETFGMTVLEAMACGVPAIVPRTGALRELVSDRRTGFHVDVDDREQLSGAIRRAWSHPLETREMGRAARHRCIEHYSPESNYQPADRHLRHRAEHLGAGAPRQPGSATSSILSRATWLIFPGSQPSDDQRSWGRCPTDCASRSSQRRLIHPAGRSFLFPTYSYTPL